MGQFCTMNITENCVVALTWTLKDTLGNELDVLSDPVEFLVGGHDLLDKIEQALQGHTTGDTLDLHLEPEDAFGDFDDRLIHLAPRQALPPDLEEGMTLEGRSLPQDCCPDADRDAFYTVSEIYPEHVILDGNHPLAGFAIRLSLTVRDVREATAEEQERGTLGVGFFSLG
jgi:FKBP-type peptidyl-prolyl cis-trans isomerase SlyD